MAKRSSHEQTIVDWFPKEQVVLNSRKLLPSKKEIDIYFPKYRVGIEINGSIWHSEAAGKTKLTHQEKFTEANKANITLLSFYDWEIKERQDLVKSIIARELNKTYNLHFSMTKRYTATAEEIYKFFAEYSLFGLANNTTFVCKSDKKGLCAVTGYRDKGDYISVDYYLERNGLHVLYGVAEECNDLRDFYKKPVVVMLAADHGILNPRYLHRYKYKMFSLSEPDFYYLQKDGRLPSNTDQDTEGYTRVFDSGKFMFVHEDDEWFLKDRTSF